MKEILRKIDDCVVCQCCDNEIDIKVSEYRDGSTNFDNILKRRGWKKGKTEDGDDIYFCCQSCYDCHYREDCQGCEYLKELPDGFECTQGGEPR